MLESHFINHRLFFSNPLTVAKQRIFCYAGILYHFKKRRTVPADGIKKRFYMDKMFVPQFFKIVFLPLTHIEFFHHCLKRSVAGWAFWLMFILPFPDKDQQDHICYEQQ